MIILSEKEDLGSVIVEKLNCKNVFTIFGIGVSEAVVVTWIIMAVILIVSLILTHNLKVENPGKRQLFAEAAVEWLDKLIGDILGKEAREYTDYLITVIIYLGFANLIGMFGFKPPTKDLRVTAALALMSIVLIEAACIRKKKLKGFLKSMRNPMNILELGIKPLSLCMRLFGNVLGAYVIMTLIDETTHIFFPVVASMYFDVFDGLIQAYIFVFLTGMFIQEQVED